MNSEFWWFFYPAVIFTERCVSVLFIWWISGYKQKDWNMKWKGWCYYRKSWGNYQVSPTSVRRKDSSNKRQWSWTRCTDKTSWAFRHSWADKQSWAADQRSSGRGITCYNHIFCSAFLFAYMLLILQSSAGWCWAIWYWIWWPEI